MGMTGNLDRYLQYQTGVAMEQAAQNPGGGASDGIGMGVGLAMANRMSDSVGAGAMPPPVPQPLEFHVVVAGSAAGPFSIAELKARVGNGSLTPASLVWSPDMSEWAAAQSVDALSGLFENSTVTPPPPPLPSS